MASVEERLSKVEREIEELKKANTNGNSNWMFPPNDQLRNDAELKEIFRLGKELRDQERREETN